MERDGISLGYRCRQRAANRSSATARFIRCADKLGQRQLTAGSRRRSRAAARHSGSDRRHAAVARGGGTPIGTRTMVCPAAFVEKKGHAILLEAFRSLPDDSSAMELHLVRGGPAPQPDRGPGADSCRWAKQSGSTASCRSTSCGRSSRTRRYAFWRVTWVRTARTRASRVTLIEAMACGAPGSPRRPALIEHLVSGDAGRLVPADPVALERANRGSLVTLRSSADPCRTAYGAVPRSSI